jgi:hypothetical protein
VFETITAPLTAWPVRLKKPPWPTRELTRIFFMERGKR